MPRPCSPPYISSFDPLHRLLDTLELQLLHLAHHLEHLDANFAPLPPPLQYIAAILTQAVVDRLPAVALGRPRISRDGR